MLDILDTAGQEEYSVMRDQYIRAGEGFLLVYSITSKGSFDELTALHDKIVMVKDVDEDEGYPMVIVGNKCDLEDEREVPLASLQALGESFKCPVFEGSAKERINVTESFIEVVREIRKHSSGSGDGPVKKSNSGRKCKFL